MKYLFTFVYAFLLFSPIAIAQQDTDYFALIKEAVNAKRWDGVERLFQSTIENNLEESETFFWKELANKSAGSSIMAWKLGQYHKDNRDFDKAHLFFTELMRIEPSDIDVMCANAEIMVLRGQENNALKLYEQVLAKEPQNLAANIFIGNYYFIYADREKNKIEKAYRNKKSPTKMEYAGYRNNLQKLLEGDYAKAKLHLERVVAQFSSAEAKKSLDKIKFVENECNKK